MRTHYWRLESPVDHPLDGLAYLRFQKVAQLKKRLNRLEVQIDRWSVDKRYMDNFQDINGRIFELQLDDVNYMIPTLVDQIHEAEIARMETMKLGDQAFRDFAEIGIRLLDFEYETLRLDHLLVDPAEPGNTALPTLLWRLSTIVSLNNNRTDLFLQLARGLGYDDELGALDESSDVSLFVESLQRDPHRRQRVHLYGFRMGEGSDRTFSQSGRTQSADLAGTIGPWPA